MLWYDPCRPLLQRSALQRFLKTEEVENDYELNTGKIIGETFSTRDYQRTPGVLVAGHAPLPGEKM